MIMKSRYTILWWYSLACLSLKYSTPLGLIRENSFLSSSYLTGYFLGINVMRICWRFPFCKTSQSRILSSFPTRNYFLFCCCSGWLWTPNPPYTCRMSLTRTKFHNMPAVLQVLNRIQLSLTVFLALFWIITSLEGDPDVLCCNKEKSDISVYLSSSSSSWSILSFINSFFFSVLLVLCGRKYIPLCVRTGYVFPGDVASLPTVLACHFWLPGHVSYHNLYQKIRKTPPNHPFTGIPDNYFGTNFNLPGGFKTWCHLRSSYFYPSQSFGKILNHVPILSAVHSVHTGYSQAFTPCHVLCLRCLCIDGMSLVGYNICKFDLHHSHVCPNQASVGFDHWDCSF